MGGCLKGHSEHKSKEGRFCCERCDAVSKKAGHLCKPDKLGKKAAKKRAARQRRDKNHRERD
jgi:hypothetical protein